MWLYDALNGRFTRLKSRDQISTFELYWWSDRGNQLLLHFSTIVHLYQQYFYGVLKPIFHISLLSQLRLKAYRIYSQASLVIKQ